MTRPNVALIGAGSMGTNHARVIAGSDRAELTWVVDPRREVGEPLAERFGARWAPDLAGTVGTTAVVIAAATEWHHHLATETLQEGLPLLVEKPMCPSLEDTEEIIRLSQSVGAPLMCGFLERYNPAFLVARGMLSEPRYVRAERHSPYAPRIRTGVAWDLLVHDVDLIAQLFGGADPDSLAVEVGQYHPLSSPGAEDVIETSLRFADGGIASASASRISQQKVRKLVIHELDRTIEVDMLRRGVTSYRHAVVKANDEGSTYRQATEIEIPEVIGKEPLVSQFDRFVDLIEGRIDADEERASALPAHRIVERALAASSAAAI
ncbi:Gfo/Idh/MocA family protein [Cellulomonas sp. URHE0023]|uniref:Gfo/Idh/MocA family protein n=1 Tax=Cellulomonas sp. URHE0023 TaxID=1380354 RepID=UPI000486D0E3|nr:Gfo/Idh/MocA family oxidoreductase [Cellulomonas sp. URHE0023]